MKCNWEWLSAYLDGALAEDKRAKLEEHLKTCEACNAKLEEFARVEQTAKKIPAPQLSEAYWENFASRVQNKLTIREKQKTSLGWLEALKSFFQPTTGKLAIAGSLAAVLLVAIIGQDYWKKEAHQLPKFEAVAPPVNDKIDSVREPAKDESAFRAARPDENKAVADRKRENEIAPAKVVGKGIIDSREDAPAALAPAEIASKPIGRQESQEEPSLAGYVERDEVFQGDTVLVTAGKKAEIRKEAATSRLKVAAEEIEKLPIRNAEGTLKVEGQNVKPHAGIRAQVPADTLKIKKDLTRKPGSPDTNIQEFTLLKGGFDAQYGGRTVPAVDTTQLVADIKKTIAEKEKELADSVSNAKTESLYIFLGGYYSSLYRFSQKPGDWNRANRRVNEFLKKELSDFTRQKLLQIQTELKKLKK